jgi:signal transduction histidine kinase
MQSPETPDELTPSHTTAERGDRQSTDDVRALKRELEKRRRQLERSEARFRDVIERNPDAQIVIDPDGMIRFANLAASRLFGRKREELAGTQFGFPVVTEETTEVDLLAGGSPRVAEMRVVRSEWEGTTAYIASLRDVTERKRAERDARRLIREQTARTVAEEHARRMHVLLESTTLLSSSLDYGVTLSSLARLCVEQIADWTVIYGLDDDGLPRRLDIAHRDLTMTAVADELRALPIDKAGVHPVLEVLRTRRPRVIREVNDETLRAMSANPRELELARSLGVASFMLVPIIARDRPLGAIAFVSASQERQFDESSLALAVDLAMRAALAMDNALLYSQAQRANKHKADFLAVVSHDLRTPLTAIMGYADLLAMGVPDKIPQRSLERVGRIRTSAKHLVYLLNELLAFARLESNREEPQFQDVDLGAIASEVASVMEPLADDRKLELEVTIPPELPTIRTDPDKLRQVLLNLVGNAIKYTKRGGVRLMLRSAEEDRIQFVVSDTGDGIAEQHLGRIFDPFWQVDPTQRSQGGGTGLGLSVVKHHIGLLGGTISVKSTVGKGSEFTVSLPANAKT